MSRSVRKTHKIKCAGNVSNKLARSRANRLHRRVNKIILQKGKEDFKHLREISDVWCFPSDGLAVYWNDLTPKELRK